MEDRFFCKMFFFSVDTRLPRHNLNGILMFIFRHMTVYMRIYLKPQLQKATRSTGKLNIQGITFDWSNNFSVRRHPSKWWGCFPRCRCIWMVLNFKTRMHSSRMRTARSSIRRGVSTRHPPGTDTPRELTPPTGSRHPLGADTPPQGADAPRRHPPAREQTPCEQNSWHAYENITLPSFAAGN